MAVTMGYYANAQKKVVNAAESALEKGELSKALENINAALQNDETKGLPNTWYIKGQIMQAIAKSTDSTCKSLSENPAVEAYDNYQKAIELDVKQKIGKKIDFQYMDLSTVAASKAIEAFNANNYEKALSLFELTLKIEQNPIFKNVIDTAMMFNCGLAANNAKKYDLAIEYFNKAVSYNYGGANTFSLIKSVQLAKGDTAAALQSLKKGIEKYSDDLGLIVDMINFYLVTNQAQEALNYISRAKEKEPSNASFLFAEGTLYEKMELPEKAVESYKKAIELDDKNFSAYFNLGVLYYNKGVAINNKATSENDNNKYNELVKQRDEEFKNSIPYFEKAHELNPKDEDVAKSLRSAYVYLQLNDKLSTLKAEMGW